MPNTPPSERSIATASGTPRFFIRWKSEDPGTFLNLSTWKFCEQPLTGSPVRMILPLLRQIAGKPAETTIRTIHQIRIQHQKELVAARVRWKRLSLSNGQNADRHDCPDCFTTSGFQLDRRVARDPGKTKTNCTAPAEGLYLVKVKYL